MKKEKKKINEKNKKEDESYWLPIGMCLGISIGTAIGAATNNIGLWLPMGLGIGLCFGVAFSSGEDENK
jgi:hypothetical protein